MKTCPQMIQVRTMRASIDYIMGTYWRCFEMLGIRGVRNYPSYHFILQARLLFGTTKAGHQGYAGNYRHKQ